MGIYGHLASLFIIAILALLGIIVLTTPGVASSISSYVVGHVNQVLTSAQNQTLASTCQDSVQAKLNTFAKGLPTTVEISIINATAFNFGSDGGQNINLINNWLSQWTLVRNSSEGALTTSLMCPYATQLGYICASVGNSTAPAAGVIVKMISQSYNTNIAYRIPVLCSAQGNFSTITPASSAYLSSEIPALAH
ncbi:MAG TPA: hypothetical protein VMV00_00890 [Candidatus Baltobacteraceae bacterium]|nr:hypothetical protein [Candidatus Baltobacteraceae bacterium]